MKRFAYLPWSSFAVLALLATTLIPAPALAQAAEVRERQEESLRRIEARLARIQEEMERLGITDAEARSRLAQLQHEIQAAHTERMAALEHELQAVQTERTAALEHERQAARTERLEVLQHDLQLEQAARLEALQERLQDVQREREERVRAMDQEGRARLADRLRNAQQVVVRMRARARLGVSLSGTQGAELDRQGARITGVTEESPAEEAGLEEGDIITHLDGQSLLQPIPDEDEMDFDEDTSLPVQRLMALARELEDGQEVQVRYLRDGEARTATLTARELPNTWTLRSPRGMEGRVYGLGPEGRFRWHYSLPDSAFVIQMDSLGRSLEDLDITIPDIRIEELKFDSLRGLGLLGGRGGNLWFRGGEGPSISVWRGGEDMVFGLAGGRIHGLDLRKLNADLGEYFSTDHGVLVLDADEDSTLGLRAGDVILAIGDREVEDVSDVLRILRSYEEDEAVSFTVMRQGREQRVEGTVG